MATLTDAVIELCEAVLASIRFEEARGEYTYEEVEMKRSIADANACDACEEMAELGWIDMDDIFPTDYDDYDEPPFHPHCLCSVEYATKRRRVYD